MELTGRVALVTGGARRVGRELSLALAREGADVVVNHSDSDEEARSLCAEIEAAGRRALPIRGDVSAKADVDRMIADIHGHFGRLDVVVNNAARFDSAPLLDITEAEWDRVMAVNLKGPFLVSQAAAPLLSAANGAIVNLADLSAYLPWPAYAHHATAKAGLVQLTRVFARALAPHVGVNCIAAGTVLPPAEYNTEDIEREAARTVLGRVGEPADVAGAMLYLLKSDFVTGTVLVVDGGRLLR